MKYVSAFLRLFESKLNLLSIGFGFLIVFLQGLYHEKVTAVMFFTTLFMTIVCARLFIAIMITLYRSDFEE